MSLMTQSLRRLAEERGGLGPDVPPLKAEEKPRREPEQDAMARQAAATADPPIKPASPADVVPKPPRPSVDEVPRPVHAPKELETVEQRTAARQFAPLAVPPPIAKLRDAILKDLGRPREGEKFGKVVVIAGIQAEADATAAVASLGRAFIGTGTGEVLVIDASSPRSSDLDEIAGDAHGFTSVIDGTRRLSDVVSPTPTAGMVFVPTGLAKGAAQAVDERTIAQFFEDCREDFGCTLVDGGEWKTRHLPIVARAADALYVVIRAHRTDRETAKKAIKFFDRAGVHVRGCILAGAEGRKQGRRSPRQASSKRRKP